MRLNADFSDSVQTLSAQLDVQQKVQTVRPVSATADMTQPVGITANGELFTIPTTNGKDGADGKDGIDGRSAYDYAVDGGYADSEAAFAKKLAEEASKAFYIEVTPAPEGGYTPDRTITAIDDAFGAGRPLYCIVYKNDGAIDCTLPLALLSYGEGYMFSGVIDADRREMATVIVTEGFASVVKEKAARIADIPDALPNPHALTINGTTYDGSEAVEINITDGDAETETVLSDNLFDKSIATQGRVFYYGGSGYQLVSQTDVCYAFVSLRGAGTYKTKWLNSQHASTGGRVAILKEDNTWLQNITGTLTATDDNNAYDMEFTVTQTMIHNGAAKIAFDCWVNYLDTAMIVKDREYPSEYIPYGYIEVATDSGKKQTNVLCEKTAVFLGDSICAGTTVGDGSEYYGYGWAGLIGEVNRMTWANYGMNGGTVTSLDAVQSTRWLTSQADKAIAEHPNADYVLFEGGCNDADQLKDAGLGEISADYSTFDTTTFSGAFESLILKLVTAYPNAQIGYIIPQKMYAVNDHSAAGHVHRRFFDRAIAICEKWGIPYVDLWNGSPLNPKLSTASQFYTDGQHLTLVGYRRITPQIEAFMRNMYVSGGKSATADSHAAGYVIRGYTETLDPTSTNTQLVTSISYDEFADIWYNGGSISLELSVEGMTMLLHPAFSGFTGAEGFNMLTFAFNLAPIGYDVMAVAFSNGTWTPPAN